MESCNAVELFNRSIALNKLRHVTYIGDGDSYRNVVDSNPYPDIVIKNGECSSPNPKADIHHPRATLHRPLFSTSATSRVLEKSG